MSELKYTQLPLFPIETKTKQCTVCHQISPATHEFFSRRACAYDKLLHRCKPCDSAIQQGNFILTDPCRCINGQKLCPGCSQIFPATDEYFYRDTSKKTGLSRRCRNCMKVKSKEYTDAHPDKIKAKTRRYWQQNRIAILQKTKLYQQNHPEKRRVWGEAYRTKHRARVKASNRKWEINNPEYVRVKTIRRRARKKELADTFTKDDYVRMMDYWGWCCAISGESSDLHIDHWIPLFAENCPGTVPMNMIPIHGRLNESKNDRDPREWLIWKFGEQRATEILAKVEAYFEWLCVQE